MSSPIVLVLDVGTTSTRAIAYDRTGRVLGSEARAVHSDYPKPGWVEQDAARILADTVAAGRAVVDRVGVGAVAAVGIANQRETVVAFDRATGLPFAPAISWQDRRTAEACAARIAEGQEALVAARAGLTLDPYFSATKLRWLLDDVPAITAAGRRAALGTLDAFLAWHLTGRFVTDASNASRTALMALEGPGTAGGGWDAELCALFGIDPALLPKIAPSPGALGTVRAEWFGRDLPLTALAGDQQSATIGQGCLKPGATKVTFGTGAFVLTATGPRRPRSRHRLLETVLFDDGRERQFALEGAAFTAGSLLNWLRDGLGLVADVADSAALAASVADTGGVHVVPAHAGLGAPHWRPDARGAITGLTLGTGRAQIIRAALEAQAHQIADLQDAFAADGAKWGTLRVDGGVIANDWLAQHLADITGLTVERPADVETTALGTAMLAAVGVGIHPDLATAAAAMRGSVRRFKPTMPPQERETRRSQWRAALAMVLSAPPAAPGTVSA